MPPPTLAPPTDDDWRECLFIRALWALRVVERDDAVTGTIIVDLDEDFVIPAGKHSIVAIAERRDHSIHPISAIADEVRPCHRFEAHCFFPVFPLDWASVAVMHVDLDNDVVLPAGKHTILAVTRGGDYATNAASNLAETDANDGSVSEETVTDGQNPIYTPGSNMSCASDAVAAASAPANPQNHVPIADIAALVESLNASECLPLCWKMLIGKLTFRLEGTRDSNGRSDYTHAELFTVIAQAATEAHTGWTWLYPIIHRTTRTPMWSADDSTFADDLHGAQEMLQKFKTCLLHFRGIEVSIDTFERYGLWSIDFLASGSGKSAFAVSLLGFWPHLKPSMFLRDDKGSSRPVHDSVSKGLGRFMEVFTHAVREVLPLVQKTVIAGIIHDEEQMTEAVLAAGHVFAELMDLAYVRNRMHKDR
ncbi:uncharacterized protein F5Z01DRAFT_164749 [Emericellopsis atlantica]|uniref:Uncharacterized protein n=1 Tax=Emericellopsis atlantica TaxID=2614577 RepID=A0A9P7ZKE6_9HYPO|nr:uncharacterized protein F5Z01DRAFT_164749 [Emericellopsis atlantica]KAG9253372.1 hypothetical protein F5Z01DRAFT_164749 [Emericellopsis atlantica]